MQKDKLKAIDAGCSDILTKPVNKVLLLKKIEDLLV
jgi:CheY-like chemotaxis protein